MHTGKYVFWHQHRLPRIRKSPERRLGCDWAGRVSGSWSRAVTAKGRVAKGQLVAFLLTQSDDLGLQFLKLSGRNEARLGAHTVLIPPAIMFPDSVVDVDEG